MTKPANTAQISDGSEIAHPWYQVDANGVPTSLPGAMGNGVQLRDANGASFGTPANPLATNQLVGTPVYGTAVLAAATGGNASLAANATKTTYINGFYVCIAHTSSGVVAGQVTLSLDSGVTTHMNFLIAVSTTYPGLVEVVFPDPIPGTAVNKSIVVTAPTLALAGIGSIALFGYQL